MKKARRVSASREEAFSRGGGTGKALGEQPFGRGAERRSQGEVALYGEGVARLVLFQDLLLDALGHLQHEGNLPKHCLDIAAQAALGLEHRVAEAAVVLRQIA